MGYLGEGGIIGAALSLSVTTIGAGVLALPSMLQEGGVALVLFTLAVVAALTVLSIDYLVLCVDLLSLRSYEDISRELLGRTSEEVVRWILIIYNIGIAAGYIVVVGEIFTPMLPVISRVVPFLSTSSHVMIFAWLIIMFPLSCIPKVTHLRFVSMAAISATFFVGVSIIYRYFFPLPFEDRPQAPITFVNLSQKSLLALPVLMFSFDCQSLVFQLYTNLSVPTRENMVRVSSISVGVTGTIYATVGFFGYLSNAPNITGNILTNYDPMKDFLFAVCESTYSITIIIAYVLVLFPCRDALFIFLYGYNSATHDLAHDAIPFWRNIGITFGLSLISLVIALKATGIIFIISLLGGLCSSNLCFTYPAAFRLALHARGLARLDHAGLATATLMLVVGLGGAVLGTYVSLFV